MSVSSRCPACKCQSRSCYRLGVRSTPFLLVTAVDFTHKVREGSGTGRSVLLSQLQSTVTRDPVCSVQPLPGLINQSINQSVSQSVSQSITSQIINYPDRVTCIPGWPGTYYVARNDLELLISCLYLPALGLWACTTLSMHAVPGIRP